MAISFIFESTTTCSDTDETGAEIYKRYQYFFADVMSTSVVLSSDEDDFVNGHMNPRTCTLYNCKYLVY